MPTIAQAILDTVIGRLVLLLLAGAGGDMIAARHAARQMLAAHNPETPDELTLAAEIISLQLHTLEALGYAADPDLSLNKILRLRGSAVSLSRESHKARRKLDQLQRARRVGAPTQSTEAHSTEGQPTEAQSIEAQSIEALPAPTHPATTLSEAPTPKPTPSQSRTENALGLLEMARQAMQTADKNKWSQSYQKRQTASRITENLKRRQAEHANLPARVDTAATPPTASPIA